MRPCLAVTRKWQYRSSERWSLFLSLLATCHSSPGLPLLWLLATCHLQPLASRHSPLVTAFIHLLGNWRDEERLQRTIDEAKLAAIKLVAQTSLFRKFPRPRRDGAVAFPTKNRRVRRPRTLRYPCSRQERAGFVQRDDEYG